MYKQAMKYSYTILPLFAVALLLGQGCPMASATNTAPTPSDDAMMEDKMDKDDAMMDKDNRMEKDDAMNDDSMMEDKMDNEDQGSAGGATYVEYSKAAYEAAIANDQPTVLFFYANWCPTCLAEEPHVKAVVAETDKGVNVIRVNTKDRDTDKDEEQLAKDFNVFTQHTFVFLDANGTETKRVIGTQGKEQLRLLVEQL
ncbi:redoxin family protein [Candidatus Uhrbacteria bacterium]|nr:redoxin family protein [Candidatus Uhrbacteria bacterium]MBD3284359.1 redoxin family protein [Candidatus Uhrbacteria bacterium]